MKVSLHLKRLSVIVLFTMVCTSLVQAQVTGKPKSASTKFNPLTVKTYLGKFTGKNNTATVAEAKNALVAAISIIDEKKFIYKLSSYQFAYTRWGAVEDEVTKQVTQKSTISADRFLETPLPSLWIDNVTENLHAGEELYFYDIIAFDKDGRRFFAPEIKIVIQ